MTGPVVPEPRDQPLLTGLAVAAIALTFPVLLAAGGFHLAMVPVIALAAALVGVRREALHGLAALALVALLWATSGAAALSPWSLALAVLMLIAHGAMSLRSCVPPGAPLDRAVVIRWLWRGAVVVAITVVVYLVGLALRHLDRGDHEVVVALVLLLLGAVVLLLRRETLDAERP